MLGDMTWIILPTQLIFRHNYSSHASTKNRRSLKVSQFYRNQLITCSRKTMSDDRPRSFLYWSKNYIPKDWYRSYTTIVDGTSVSRHPASGFHPTETNYHLATSFHKQNEVIMGFESMLTTRCWYNQLKRVTLTRVDYCICGNMPWWEEPIN